MDSYDEKERMEALEVLSNDMLDYLPEKAALSSDAISSALSGSYTVYEAYVPFYDVLTEDYLGMLVPLLSPLVVESVPLLREVSEHVVSDLPENAFIADSGFTEEMRGLCRLDVIDLYESLLDGVLEEMLNVYRPFEREFLLVRASYVNLGRVGGEIYLPYPEPCGVEELATALADFLFEALAEAESDLKNRPPEGPDSPYMLFWRQA